MVPVSNHLMDTESDFAPWDLSKAHILVSTPVFLKPPHSNRCQVGFTTDPVDDRSTMYTSDVGTLLQEDFS